MMNSYVMIRDVANYAKRIKLCDKPDDDFKNKIKEKVIKNEGVAFRNTANKGSRRIAHPGPLSEAESYVMAKHGMIEIKYPNI